MMSDAAYVALSNHEAAHAFMWMYTGSDFDYVEILTVAAIESLWDHDTAAAGQVHRSKRSTDTPVNTVDLHARKIEMTRIVSRALLVAMSGEVADYITLKESLLPDFSSLDASSDDDAIRKAMYFFKVRYPDYSTDRLVDLRNRYRALCLRILRKHWDFILSLGTLLRAQLTVQYAQARGLFDAYCADTLARLPVRP